MEELIRIAFSSINSRVECAEKEIKNMYKLIEEMSRDLDKQKNKLLEILLDLENKNYSVNDEVEVYKFGEQ